MALNIKNSLLLIFTQKYNDSVHKIPVELKYNLLHFLDIFLYIYLVFILPFQIWTPFYAVKHIIIPYLLLSSIFTINSSINHTHKESINGQNKN